MENQIDRVEIIANIAPDETTITDIELLDENGEPIDDSHIDYAPIKKPFDNAIEMMREVADHLKIDMSQVSIEGLTQSEQRLGTKLEASLRAMRDNLVSFGEPQTPEEHHLMYVAKKDYNFWVDAYGLQTDLGELELGSIDYEPKASDRGETEDGE
jgi:hypothetical protein